MKVAARAFSARQRIAVAACATLALWVHHLALGRFFSPDDLVLLERVRGVAPPLPSLWRWPPARPTSGAVAPWFGSNPFLYLLVNGLLHASNVALVYCVVRRRGGSALAGIAAAGLFGASRHGFALLGQAVGVGDLLALALTLAACLLVTSRAVTARASAWSRSPARCWPRRAWRFCHSPGSWCRARTGLLRSAGGDGDCSCSSRLCGRATCSRPTFARRCSAVPPIAPALV